MNLPVAVRPFWDTYAAKAPDDAAARLYEVFRFGDSEALVEKLTALVLAGSKRATASLLWEYEATGKPLPRPGSLSIATSWSGAPRCIIETTRVDVVPFNRVPADFARAEGEGDGSLEAWREAHWSFFTRECARIGRTPRADMPVVCERFEVVHR